jgi:hypothetical protein
MYKPEVSSPPSISLRNITGGISGVKWLGAMEGKRKLPYGAFELQIQETARFNRKLHRELLKYLFTVSVDDELYGLFLRKTSSLEVKKLIFGDFRRRGLMLNHASRISHSDIGEGIGLAVASN